MPDHDLSFAGARIPESLIVPIQNFCHRQLNDAYGFSLALFKTAEPERVESVLWYGCNATDLKPPASLLKVAICMLACELAHDGHLSFEREVSLSELGSTNERSVTSLLADNRRLNILELAGLALCVSDNRASDALLELVGLDEFKRYFFKQYGCDLSPYRGFSDDDLTTTVPQVLAPPRVFTEQYLALSTRAIFRPIVQIMGQSLLLGRLAYDVPAAIKHINKTGTLTPPGVFNDMICMRLGDLNLAATFMSRGAESKAAAETKMREISRLLGDALLSWKAT